MYKSVLVRSKFVCNVSKGCVYYGKLPFFTLLLKNCDISLGMQGHNCTKSSAEYVNHKAKQLHGLSIEMKMWSPLVICCGCIHYSNTLIDEM